MASCHRASRTKNLARIREILLHGSSHHHTANSRATASVRGLSRATATCGCWHALTARGRRGRAGQPQRRLPRLPNAGRLAHHCSTARRRGHHPVHRRTAQPVHSASFNCGTRGPDAPSAHAAARGALGRGFPEPELPRAAEPVAGEHLLRRVHLHPRGGRRGRAHWLEDEVRRAAATPPRLRRGCFTRLPRQRAARTLTLLWAR